MSLDEEYDDQVAVLYRRYAGRVQGFLISTGCDRGLAEEITDDAFLSARRRWAHVGSLTSQRATSSRWPGMSAASGRKSAIASPRTCTPIRRGPLVMT